MNKEHIAEAIKELMDAYNAARTEWRAKLGDDFDEAAFHAWFTEQVMREKRAY